MKITVKEAGGRIPMSFDYVMAVELADNSPSNDDNTASTEATAKNIASEQEVHVDGSSNV